MATESLSLVRPRLSGAGSSPLLAMRSNASLSSCSLLSVRFDSMLRPRSRSLSLATNIFASKGLPLGLLSFHQRNSCSRLTVAFSASHEDLRSENEVEKDNIGIESGVEESQEAWEKTLASFKEQAIKMQSVSQEAYEVYSEKALIVLKETSEQFKIQAAKASHDLSVIAKEISEEGRDYLSKASKDSPEEVREIVETFTTPTDDLKEISKVQDFYLGIPYGLVLSLGGFLSFMITGSTAAIRFGVILGGALLALSISSLRLYKQGKQFPLALKGQAVIAAILFLRETRILFQRTSVFSVVTTSISGAMVAFYIYRILVDGSWGRGLSSKIET